jgi:hypothetical protein
MSTVRARFDGKAFIPEKAVHLPVGEVVEVQFSAESVLEAGSPRTILRAMATAPKVSAEDTAELERLIEEGSHQADFDGAFDAESDSDDNNERGE